MSSPEEPAIGSVEAAARSDSELRVAEPVAAPSPAPAGEALPTLVRTVEALLFLSSDPLSAGRAGRRDAGRARARCWRRWRCSPRQYAPGRRGIRLRELGGGWTLASDPASRGRRPASVQPPARSDAHARAGRDARDRRLPAADLAPRDHPYPRRQRRLRDRHAARPRPDRGGRSLPVRRGAVPHHARSS